MVETREVVLSGIEYTCNFVCTTGFDHFIKSWFSTTNEKANARTLRQWGFRQCLLFSWTTLRDKHCRNPIAVIGVVDTFGQCGTLVSVPDYKLILKNVQMLFF